MSMPAEHDDRLDDEVLQRVVAELRRPVRLDPAVDQRALDEIGSEAAGWPASRHGHRWGAWLAGGAIAAGLLLALLPESGPREPATAVAPAPPAPAAGGRSIHLRLEAPASSRVAVVGDFNDWDPAATPLRPAGDDGTWVVELRLKPGRYRYTFLIDGRRWERDPSESPAAESDFGAPVSVLTVS
jgi:hypothetical protein